ncbi:hypothetical protein H8S90_13065 [Olivibacter sp. SDN3]|uniref:hypothetical protein n=1 Tax=Olivibacter sp. SDN3 TaxID=2764720 RepID=UPI0016515C3E|nr:hypothetical protein [Olivibacter sp. SDN3]QNL47754.1 hypothetical protein H8S90_13065 [Olivibacter sp. SDN3]
MKKILSLALIGFVLASCGGSSENADSQQQELDPNLITCESIGKVRLSYSHEDLETEFGADNLEDGTEEIDGKEVNITKVFPGTAEEVVVAWTEDSAPFSKAAKLSVSDEMGPYQLEEGIRVGSTIKELVQANNFLPVTFTNFYAREDGFAYIQSFNDGDLAQKYPCLGGVLDIDRTDNLETSLLEEFKLENPAKSNHKAMNFIYANVVELSISAE